MGFGGGFDHQRSWGRRLLPGRDGHRWTRIFQARRAGIFVVYGFKTNQAPSRSDIIGICRPTGLDMVLDFGSTNMPRRRRSGRAGAAAPPRTRGSASLPSRRGTARKGVQTGKEFRGRLSPNAAAPKRDWSRSPQFAIRNSEGHGFFSGFHFGMLMPLACFFSATKRCFTPIFGFFRSAYS